MSVRCCKCYVFYQSCNGEGFNAGEAGIKEQQVRDYLKKYPMPKDNNYSEEDLVGDISNSGGIYTLDEKAKPETAKYISAMLDELWV